MESLNQTTLDKQLMDRLVRTAAQKSSKAEHGKLVVYKISDAATWQGILALDEIIRVENGIALQDALAVADFSEIAVPLSVQLPANLKLNAFGKVIYQEASHG